MSTVLYVQPKNDEHLAMLIDHYEMLGYYVTKVDGRLRVTWTRPAKPKRKNEEKRTDSNSREASDRPRDTGQKAKPRQSGVR